MKSTLLCAALVLTLAGPAAMGQRIEKRKDRQAERIEQGKESGELNQREARRLKARERNLKRDIREDRKDGGGLTPKERAKIEKRQDKLSHDIHKQKHDEQKAAPKQ